MKVRKLFELITMLERNDFENAYNESEKLLSEKEIDIEEKVEAAIINGYSGALTGKINQAEDILKEVEQYGIFLKDIYFLLSFIYSIKKDYQSVLDYGKKFFKIYEDEDSQELQKEFINVSSRVHELLNNLGTAALNLDNKKQAIEFFKKGIEANDKYPLFYQNLAVIYYKDEKFKEVEEILDEGKKKCPQDPELPRIAGVMYRENKIYKTAEKELIKSLTLGSTEALFELGLLYFIKGKVNQAEEHFKEYLNHVPDERDALTIMDEIKKSPRYGKKDPTISAAMIVKDEEDMLPQCLRSVIDVVDEIIVVDTGSKDKTVEIAEGFGAKVYHHPWKNDFSEARNHSLNRASKEWILIIDADEELERQDYAKIFAYSQQYEADAVCFAIYSTLPGQLGGINMGKHYAPRLFKNRDDIYYEGIVHNLLKTPENTVMSDIRLYHYGYNLREDKMWNKYQRSIKLLLKQVEEKPDDPYIRYNTAQMFLSRNYMDEAEEHALKVIELLEPDDKKQQHIYLMALYQLTLINQRRGDFDEAEKYAYQALDIKEDYIDPILSLGWIYFYKKEYDKAEEILNRYIENLDILRKKEYYDSIILNKLGGDYEAYTLLGNIYYNRNNYENSERYFAKALDSNPFYWVAYHGLAKIFTDKDDFEAASEFYENAIKYGYLNVEKYGTLGVASNVYKKMLHEYKDLLLKEIQKAGSKDKLKSAFKRIDKIISNSKNQ